jgi:hypothetical protein
MKKALLFTILSLFLCTNFAFATSEAVSNVVFQGTIATLKDGFLPATITLQTNESYPPDTPVLFTGLLTIKADKDGKNFYNETFKCTGYYDENNFIVTTKGTAILSGNLSTGSFVLQIPADGITGKFQF